MFPKRLADFKVRGPSNLYVPVIGIILYLRLNIKSAKIKFVSERVRVNGRTQVGLKEEISYAILHKSGMRYWLHELMYQAAGDRSISNGEWERLGYRTGEIDWADQQLAKDDTL